MGGGGSLQDEFEGGPWRGVVGVALLVVWCSFVNDETWTNALCSTKHILVTSKVDTS